MSPTIDGVAITDEELAEFRQWQSEKHNSEQAQTGEGVHVTFLLDRSGSMQSIRDDVIGGFNAFVKDQRSMPGRCLLTLWTFDSKSHDQVYDAADIHGVRDMTYADFVPRAGTPLFDAIGRTIASMDARGASNDRQILVIFTDGLENASVEYNRERILALIKGKEELGWTIVYLGANVDAYAESARVGVPQATTQNFVADSAGVGAAMSSTSRAVLGSRAKTYAGKETPAAAFYEGGKDADEDHANRGSSS